MSGDPFDAQGEAHEALSTAVGSYGTRVLGDPRILGNLVGDLLPDQPRERSLLVTAAEAGVAAELVQHVEGQHVDVDTAVALVARSLTETRSLDLTASTWVATEYAQALGYQTRPQGEPTVIGKPVQLPGADTVVPKPPLASPSVPPVPGGSPAGGEPSFAPASSPNTRFDLKPAPRFTPTQQPPVPGSSSNPPQPNPPQPAADPWQKPRDPWQKPQDAWQKPQDAWASPAAAPPPPVQPQPAQQPWQPAPAPAPQPQQWQPTEVAQPAHQPWQPTEAAMPAQPAPSPQPDQQPWQATEVALPPWQQSNPPQQAAQQPWQPAPPPQAGQQPWQPTPPAPPLNPWPAAGGGGGRPPRNSRTGLIAGGGVAAVIVLYLIIAAVAQTFPFSKSSARPSPTVGLSSPVTQPSASSTPKASPSVPATPAASLAAGVKKLKVLLPFDVTSPDTDCVTQTKIPWQNPGLVSAKECDASDMAGGQIFGYQLDSAADYNTAWHNYNVWAKFSSTKTSANCPPASGQTQGGPVGWHGPRFKSRSGQVLECFTSSDGPVYVWTYPTEDAFMVAQPPKSWSYKKLDSWWGNQAK